MSAVRSSWPDGAAAYLAVARLEAAGVEARLQGDGRLAMRPAGKVSPDLLATVRQHKAAIAALLRLRLAEPHRLVETEPAP